MGPAGPEGGLVNSTRGLIFPKAAAAATSMAAWRQAIDDAVEASRAALASLRTPSPAREPCPVSYLRFTWP